MKACPLDVMRKGDGVWSDDAGRSRPSKRRLWYKVGEGGDA